MNSAQQPIAASLIDLILCKDMSSHVPLVKMLPASFPFSMQTGICLFNKITLFIAHLLLFYVTYFIVFSDVSADIVYSSF